MPQSMPHKYENESTYNYTHIHLRVAFLGNHLLKNKGSNLLPALLPSNNPLLPVSSNRSRGSCTSGST